MVEEAPKDRMGTGIAGLDDLIYGGIPLNSQVLILGEPGAGKTLLSFNIAYKSASEGIPSTFLTIEEEKKPLIKFISETFSSLDDMNDLITNNKLRVEEKRLQYAIKSPENIQAVVADIIRTAEKNGSKLLVIDSFSLLRSLYPDDRSFTRGINYVVESIRSQGITSIITFEMSSSSDKPPGLLEDSMFDGIVRLSRRNVGTNTEYLLNVVKMRYTRFKSLNSSITITPSGIIVQPV